MLVFSKVNYLKPVWVRSSCLTHEDSSSLVQFHRIWWALKLHHLRLRGTVGIKRQLFVGHWQGEGTPRVQHARHVKAGCLIRSLGTRFGVEELHLLTAGLHRAELHADEHQLLWPVCDGEEDGGSGRGGFDVENEWEVTEEVFADVSPGKLPRWSCRGQVVGRFPSRSRDFRDTIRWKVSNKLGQSDAIFLCKRTKMGNLYLVQTGKKVRIHT